MNDMNTDAGMPIAITLEPGIYFRCTCGKSSTLPFCDGGHSGSNVLPLRFELTERQKVYICSCGKTGKAPFCDGHCGVALPK
ncbi:MAG: CDGSH iron-sulfur domain-containing protein [Desulfuromonadaceae bacterium]|nr:CDGSH iron-sulfur domain-containing protein [Desulfuromonadaceae bacterium]